MENLSGPIRIDVQLKNRRPFWAQSALAVGTAVVAFDIDDLTVDRVNQGRAADRAIGANTWRRLGIPNSKPLRARDHGRQVDA